MTNKLTNHNFMNQNKFSLFAMLIMAMMFSCTNDNELTSSKSEYVNSVRVTVEDFLPENASRTSYTVDNNGFHFQWTDGDALGIYPVGGDQVKFPISKGDGASTATFDGGAWKLRSEYQYAAYYPFSAGNYTISERALPVSYTGQTQKNNGSTAHLGAYDYLACAATTPDANGGVDLTMKHLGAFVRLQLTMPRADTYSSVVLESDGTEFVTAGTFDLTASTPAITPTETSSTYTINLNNVVTTDKDQVITVYAIVAPANLSTDNIKVTVHGTGQATYVQTVTGKNFVARSAYNIAIDNFPSGTNASGEDVNWEDTPAFVPEAVDLGLSVKWASCNIGATTPEGYGDYFAWGATTPFYESGYAQENPQKHWKAGKSDGYVWNNTPYQTVKDFIPGGSRRWAKYLGSTTSYEKDPSATDADALKFVLDPEDDAAHVNWGGSWRMPTYDEQEELRTKCTWTWTTQNRVSGCKVTGPNGNFIFLPAAGLRFADELSNVSYNGYYWSSRLCDPTNAFHLYVSENYVQMLHGGRVYGLSVRAVCK